MKLLRVRQPPQMKATKRVLTDLLPYALPAATGLLALPPAVQERGEEEFH